MAKRRDYAAEYARRNELAQQHGWKSAAQERYAKEQFRQMPIDIQGKWGRFELNKGRDLSPSQLRDAFRTFWQGLLDPNKRDERSATSAKARWFVEYLNEVSDYETWENLYGGE